MEPQLERIPANELAIGDLILSQGRVDVYDGDGNAINSDGDYRKTSQVVVIASDTDGVYRVPNYS